jgi:glutathione synthase/RimK-type ligase-like ATP-grasp enzyme
MAKQVAVLTKTGPNSPPSGAQLPFFMELLKEAQDMGIELFFFGPQKWADAVLSGWEYRKGRWVAKESSLPARVYDRYFTEIPSERSFYEQFRIHLARGGICFANPVPLMELTNDKWAFHAFLTQHSLPSLPVFLCSEMDAQQCVALLEASGCLYVKPILGSRGKGIATVERQERGAVVKAGGKTRIIAPEALLSFLQRCFPPDQYFIQPGAALIPFENRAYDVRVLVQQTGEGAHQVTGMGVRVGVPGSSVSNLHAGGAALPLEALESILAGAGQEDWVQRIGVLSLDCARALASHFGPFAELGFDILLTKDQGPVLLEANSKPARWIFNLLAAHFPEGSEEALYYRRLRTRSVAAPLHFLAKYKEQGLLPIPPERPFGH